MPNPVLILSVGAAIGAASLGLALLIGQAIALKDKAVPPPEPDDLTAMVQPESWAPAEEDEWTVLVPRFITAEMFSLDNEINRQGRREWLA